MALARKRLQPMRRQVQRLVFLDAAVALGAADVVIINAVGAVILRLEPKRARLQLEVQVFGNEDRRRRLRIGEVRGGGEDAMIRLRKVGEKRARSEKTRRLAHELPA